MPVEMLMDRLLQEHPIYPARRRAYVSDRPGSLDRQVHELVLGKPVTRYAGRIVGSADAPRMELVPPVPRYSESLDLCYREVARRLTKHGVRFSLFERESGRHVAVFSGGPREIEKFAESWPPPVAVCKAAVAFVTQERESGEE